MEDAQFKKISLPNFKRNNLVEMVFQSLKQHILDGKFKGGDRLPNQEVLAQQFGVSRTVIREALHKLSSLGLIESLQGRGTFVRAPDARTVMEPMFAALLLDETSVCELMEARYYLEKAIAHLAAMRISSSQLDLLQQNVVSMEKSVKQGNIEMFAREDLDFHLQLAAISNNNILHRILQTLREMLSNFFDGFSHTPGVAENAVTYHRGILEALKTRDAEQAELVMQQHILDVTRVLREKYHVEVML